MKEEKEAEIMKGEDEEKKEKLEKICSVSWHGKKEKKEILIGKDFVDKFFSKEQGDILFFTLITINIIQNSRIVSSPHVNI